MNHKALLDTPKQGERVTSAPIVAPHQQPPLGKKRWNLGTGLFISSTNTLISSEPILECSFLKTPPSKNAILFKSTRTSSHSITQHTHTHTHTMHTHIQTHIHTYIYTYTRTLTQCTHTYKHTYIYTYTRTLTQCTHIQTHIHIYIHTYTLIHIQQTHILLSKYNIGLQCGSGI